MSASLLGFILSVKLSVLFTFFPPIFSSDFFLSLNKEHHANIQGFSWKFHASMNHSHYIAAAAGVALGAAASAIAVMYTADSKKAKENVYESERSLSE